MGEYVVRTTCWPGKTVKTLYAVGDRTSSDRVPGGFPKDEMVIGCCGAIESRTSCEVANDDDWR